MGNPKQRWTADEEEALMAGVRKHGPGKWKTILNDPLFTNKLIYRSNVDLKDKWRNMPAHFQSMTPQIQTPTSNKSQTTRKHTSNAKVPSTNSRYHPMIFEALSPSNSPRGSEFGGIAGFIEKKYDVPDNFRKLLAPEMKKLVLQDKIEKVGKHYKVKEVNLSSTLKPPEEKVVVLTQITQPVLTVPPKTLEDAAAYEIAESENKALEAAKAVAEYERISQMAAEADAMLIFCQEVRPL